jgi:hypothetical protein
VFAYDERCLCFSSEIDEKLIKLVRKCEELYDMANKEYSDSLWKKKMWGQIGKELKKQIIVTMCFIAHFELTIIVVSPNF